jgi:hypothetical protein
MHNCHRCGYSTNIKSAFLNHLKRKRQCKSVISDIPIQIMRDMYNVKSPSPITTSTPQSTPVQEVVSNPQLFSWTNPNPTPLTPSHPSTSTPVVTPAPFLPTNCILQPIVSPRGYLYLLREREFIKTNELIFKVGKTTQNLYQRINKYPKDSELIMAIRVADCHTAETALLKELRRKYIQRRDIGHEYFEGEQQAFMKELSEFI